MIYLHEATKSHINEMCNIYNDAINYTDATFDITPIDIDKFYKQYMKNCYKSLVAISEKKVVGWSSLTKWSQREGYKYSAEISIYIDSKYQKLNIGFTLCKAITTWAINNNLHCILSFCTEGNIGTEKINKKLNFKKIGTIKEIGYKFNKYHNLEIWQLVL